MKRLSLIVVAVVALMVSAPAAQSTASGLKHLESVDELKAWFNGGTGHPRLILLLSPT